MSHERGKRKKTPKSKKQVSAFFSGVLILTAANLLIKAAGLLFKIPMNYIVGDTGMGYYSSAYSVYTFLYMLSTSGLPVAVSILVAESRAIGRISEVRRVFRMALLLFLVIGAAGCGGMLLFSEQLAGFIGSAPTEACIIAIAPTLFFICISSAYRGFFQGYQEMLPIAVSQLIEAVCKLVLGIGAALYSIRMGYGIHITAAYAVSGISVGSFIGMLYLITAKLLFRSQTEETVPEEAVLDSEKGRSVSAVLKKFAVISIPITVSAAVMSVSSMIDAVLIQRVLQMTGMAQEEATTLYGNYTSLAVPMFNLPPVLIYPITCAMIPLLTASRTEVDHKRTKTIVESALRASVLLGLPCAFGMSALSLPILRLFYKDASAYTAAPLLSLLAPASLFVCILAVTNAVLQACGRAGKPVISMLAGTAVKILSGIVLVRIIGIRGAPLSTFLCYFTASVLNFAFVIRYTGIRPDFSRLFLKPLLGGFACGCTAFGGYYILSAVLSEKASTFAAIGLGASAYCVVIFLTKAVEKADLNMMPGWSFVEKLIYKIKRKKSNHEPDHKRKAPQGGKA